MTKLTAREELALRLIGDGYTYTEIGKEMGIATRTAKQYGAILRSKLGVEHKRELIPAARQHFQT